MSVTHILTIISLLPLIYGALLEGAWRKIQPEGTNVTIGPSPVAGVLPLALWCSKNDKHLMCVGEEGEYYIKAKNTAVMPSQAFTCWTDLVGECVLRG